MEPVVLSKIDKVYTTCLSDSFIESWKNLLINVYKYVEYDNFLIVPSIFGQKVYSYLPLLNYTNKLSQNLPEQLANVRPFSYQLRLLNSTYRDFQTNDTVVMRVSLKGKNSEEIWKSVLSHNMKKQLKKSFKEKFTIQRGTQKELIYQFYKLFSKTMSRLGTPVFGIDLFLQLPKFIDSKYFVVYYENQPVSAMLLVYDNDIVWCPYSGYDEKYQDLRPSHFMFWNGILDSCEKSKVIFDFGRSAYGNNNFFFKERWSAIPVKVDIIKPKQENIYNKYTIASKIYKIIPERITSHIGPLLCKRLSDL